MSVVPSEIASRSGARNKLVLVVYTTAIFTSALLLFSGAAAVHEDGVARVWEDHRRSGRWRWCFSSRCSWVAMPTRTYLMTIQNRVVPIAIHLALLVVAMLTLPLSIASGWGDPPSSGYAFWLLGLFVVSIGLPFFALAANNPMLQAWFVRTGHPDGPDPYFLYASSNIGSFLALLSYPILLEPMFTLRTQNLIWTGGYGLLIILIAACGFLLVRSPPMSIAAIEASDGDAPPPTWMTRARWIFSRRRPVWTSDCGDGTYFDGYCSGTFDVGAAAVALFADMGSGVSVASAAAA